MLSQKRNCVAIPPTLLGGSTVISGGDGGRTASGLLSVPLMLVDCSVLAYPDSCCMCTLSGLRSAASASPLGSTAAAAVVVAVAAVGSSTAGSAGTTADGSSFVF